MKVYYWDVEFQPRMFLISLHFHRLLWPRGFSFGCSIYPFRFCIEVEFTR